MSKLSRCWIICFSVVNFGLIKQDKIGETLIIKTHFQLTHLSIAYKISYVPLLVLKEIWDGL